MLDMETIKNFSIDKSDWKKVKFGDVVFEPKESVKDPISEGIEHVVGLEHIDSEEIHLRRSANIEESTTFTKKFRKGDVLFGRRRAYLKKASKAGFDGICSGDITVMRAKEELLSQDLLPFIVNNEKFFDYAITHSAGGLSPRVKFKDLTNYEFMLPPKDKLANTNILLTTLDTAIENSKKNIFHLLTLKRAFMKEVFNKGLNHNDFKVTSIGEVPSIWNIHNFKDVLSGMKSGLSRRIVAEDIGIPVLISGNIQEDKLDVSELKYWYVNDPQGANISDYMLKNGDILLCFINSLAQIGKCCMYDDIGRDSIYTTNLFRIVGNDKIDQQYLYYFICSDYIQRKIQQITKPAVNQASFTKEDFLNIKLALPPIEEQKNIVRKLVQLDKTIESAKTKENAFIIMQKGLLAKVF